MIKAVIFDFGGVVVNEGFVNWISANIAPYKSIEHEMSDLEDKVNRGDLPVDAYNEYLGKKTGKDPLAIEKEILQSYTLHDDVVVFIKKLRSLHIKTAILSNFPKRWFYHIRTQLHFEHLFDKIFISSELHLIKPDPEIFYAALKQLKVAPAHTAFVDDRKKYVDVVNTLGIHGIVFTSSDSLLEDLHKLGLAV